MLSIEMIRDIICEIAPCYGVKTAELFGSYALGTANSQSDVDLLLEFDMPGISLLKLSEIKLNLQDLLGVAVDVIHGPVPKGSLLSIEKRVLLYDA